MVKAFVTPPWKEFPGSRAEYFDRNLTEFDEKSWGGTVREQWIRTRDFLCYLKEHRVGELNETEAYEILEQNIDRLLAGQPLVWAVEKFGYDRARELKDKPFAPNRDRFYVAEDGSRIPTRDQRGRFIGYFGGVTDGTYLTLGLHLGAIINATFGISEHDIWIGGKQLSIDEKAELYSREKLPFQIVEKRI
ncbi:hypothetical protein HYU22_01685 [Candidatus Woesearchaeota archaeon]|nr:hypothetical protein [Candidatus Woesearchaeota archaeon]